MFCYMNWQVMLQLINPLAISIMSSCLNSFMVVCYGSNSPTSPVDLHQNNTVTVTNIHATPHTFSLRAFTSASRSSKRAFFRSLELWAATLFFSFLKCKITRDSVTKQLYDFMCSFAYHDYNFGYIRLPRTTTELNCHVYCLQITYVVTTAVTCKRLKY
jgi:hypothetical protein